MIRLIVTDLDGTLLDDEKKLPPDFFEVLAELNARGIAFAVASGRSYLAAGAIFGAAAKEMNFLCDNGAFLVERGENTFRSVISRAQIEEMDAAVLKLGDRVRAILCGADGSWMRDYSENAQFKSMLASYHTQLFYTDPSQVTEDVFKVAVCDLDGAGQHAYPILKAQFGAQMNVMHSGMYYLDMVNPDVDKGSALRKLQAKLGVTAAQTMAFGDYFNDVSLLKEAENSFIMENAPAEMHAHARFHAGNNNQGGVVRAIKRYVLENQPLPAAGTPWSD